MISVDPKRCCGCAACADICPTKAISMMEKEEHFSFPNIEENKCIDCKLCDKVCPYLNIQKPINRSTTVFSAYAKDPSILNKGSSGSIFYQLAKIVIEDKGVVFGAAFDSKNKLHHVKASKIEELDKLCKSKYIQSQTNGIYSEVKKAY